MHLLWIGRQNVETRNLTCIGCPMGCQLTVTYEPGCDKDSINVTGNTCPKGKAYAVDEVTNPTRIVTGTVRISNRPGIVVPVKTKTVIPKGMIKDIAAELMNISVEAPCHIGEVACANILGTGSDLVITKNID